MVLRQESFAKSHLPFCDDDDAGQRCRGNAGGGRLARQMGRSRCPPANDIGRPQRLMGKNTKNTGESQLSEFPDKNGYTPGMEFRTNRGAAARNPAIINM